MKSLYDYDEILSVLKESYDNGASPSVTLIANTLKTPYNILVSTIISLRTKDQVTLEASKQLFAKANNIQQLLDLSEEEISQLIYPAGFYKTKAKNIKAYAKRVLEAYNGSIPKDMDELIPLPGIGRKSANVIMLEAFNMPLGIAVDTHAKRISNRLGLSTNTDPTKIEQDLLKIIPKEYYKDVNHLFIWHGRNICSARNPNCDKCPISKFCKFFNEKT